MADSKDVIKKRLDSGDRLVAPVVVPNFQDPSNPYVAESTKEDATAILNDALT